MKKKYLNCDCHSILENYNIFSPKLLAIILAVRGTGSRNLYTICKRNPFFGVTRFFSNLSLDFRRRKKSVNFGGFSKFSLPYMAPR